MQNIYQLGEKNESPPLFSSLFNKFFPPTCYLAIFLGPNIKIYTPVVLFSVLISEETIPR